jgi:hypothetical protein
VKPTYYLLFISLLWINSLGIWSKGYAFIHVYQAASVCFGVVEGKGETGIDRKGGIV